MHFDDLPDPTELGLRRQAAGRAGIDQVDVVDRADPRQWGLPMVWPPRVGFGQAARAVPGLGMGWLGVTERRGVAVGRRGQRLGFDQRVDLFWRQPEPGCQAGLVTEPDGDFAATADPAWGAGDLFQLKCRIFGV